MKANDSFVPWWRIQYTESDIDSVTRSMRAEHISLGPVTASFEAKLAEQLGIPYVVATTSGSMALLMALMALNIGPGDEVIVPNRTWIAAAHAVTMVGAKVVFVDVLADIPIIDVNQVQASITPRTKAIIPTALSGRAINFKALKRITEPYQIAIIEDAAQATFSCEDNQYAGTQGELGCFSLSVAKLLPTGQGGFVATKDKTLYQALKSMRTHGVADLLHCRFERFGFNFRYTDLQASLGLSQLETIPSKIQSLNAIYTCYEQGLKDCNNVRLIPIAINKKEVPLYIEVLCPKRDELVNFLEKRQIQTKVFYPNLNRAKYFGCDQDFPQANVFETQGLTLPSGPDQSMQHIERVVDAICAYDALITETETKKAVGV